MWKTTQEINKFTSMNCIILIRDPWLPAKENKQNEPFSHGCKLSKRKRKRQSQSNMFARWEKDQILISPSWGNYSHCQRDWMHVLSLTEMHLCLKCEQTRRLLVGFLFKKTSGWYQVFILLKSNYFLTF